MVIKTGFMKKFGCFGLKKKYGKWPVSGFLFFCLTVTVIFSSATKSVSLEVIDRIVAVVNDELITYSMLAEAFQPYEKKIRERNYPLEQEMEMRFKIREDLINKLIDQKIIDQEIAKAQIQVSAGEVENSIERIKRMNSFTDEDLRKMLQAEGLTLEKYKKEIKNQLLRTRLLQYEVNSKIVVTEEEIETYYEEHKDQFGDKSLKDVSALIEDNIFKKQVDEKYKEWVADFRGKAHIKIIQ